MNRPAFKPSPRLIGYLAADLFGFFCIALGVSWLAGAPGLILADFPRSTVEAVASAAGGVAVIAWAIGGILRELGRLAPPQPADD